MLKYNALYNLLDQRELARRKQTYVHIQPWSFHSSQFANDLQFINLKFFIYHIYLSISRYEYKPRYLILPEKTKKTDKLEYKLRVRNAAATRPSSRTVSSISSGASHKAKQQNNQ